MKLRRLDSRRRFNYTLSQPGRFLYVRVAKVATRSLTTWLASEPSLEVRYCDRVPLPPFARQRYFVFGFVRSPWDRLVSCWRNKIVQPDGTGFPRDAFPEDCSLEAFVEVIARWDLSRCNRHVRRQVDLLPRRLDFLGRFEHLRSDIDRLAPRIGVPASDFPHANASAAATFPSYYTPALVDRVAKLYASDIEAFGYRFEPESAGTPRPQASEIKVTSHDPAARAGAAGSAGLIPGKAREG